MSEIVHKTPELVVVTWESELEAILISWDTLYREDSAIMDTLEFCFDYVRANGVKNWVADVSRAKAQLSKADAEWADGHFNKTIVTLGLASFILVTAPRKEGEVSDIEQWLEESKRKIGDSLAMFHATSMNEVRKIIKIAKR